MTNRGMKLVLRSLDSSLGKRDRRKLEKALAGSGELRRSRDRLLALRQAAAEGAGRSFEPHFAERVLGRLREDSQAGGARRAVRGFPRPVLVRLAATALLILAVWLCVAAGQVEIIPRDAIFYVSGQTIDRILQVLMF